MPGDSNPRVLLFPSCAQIDFASSLQIIFNLTLFPDKAGWPQTLKMLINKTIQKLQRETTMIWHSQRDMQASMVVTYTLNSHQMS